MRPAQSSTKKLNVLAEKEPKIKGGEWLFHLIHSKNRKGRGHGPPQRSSVLIRGSELEAHDNREQLFLLKPFEIAPRTDSGGNGEEI